MEIPIHGGIIPSLRVIISDMGMRRDGQAYCKIFLTDRRK